MQISFIAVQCFECSTMQVKQQKKSSNKWSCVVCNQKQSVRKVFAQSFMAKDVRKFVQNFNMSRQLSDQQQLIAIDEPQIVVESPKSEEQKRKRNDWTEYIDDDREEDCAKFEKSKNSAQGDDGIEPVVVTEMPKATFVKPKLRNYSGKEKKLFKPSFPNRKDGKNSQDLERDSQRDYTVKAKDESSKWSGFMAQIQETRDLSIAKKPTHQMVAGKNTVSKWSSFISEEDGDNDDGDKNKREDDYLLEMSMNEERVRKISTRISSEIHTHSIVLNMLLFVYFKCFLENNCTRQAMEETKLNI